MRSLVALAGWFGAAVLLAMPACMSLDGLSETDPPGAQTKKGGATITSGKTCSAATVKVRDSFDGRTSAAALGWAKGRVSDAVPSIAKPEAGTAAVLTSRVDATTDDNGKSTSYIEREIPTTGCIAAEFVVRYTEEAAFPSDAWTYFFWIDAADEANVSLFRQGNVVRLAVQRGGSEISRIDVEVPPKEWTKIKVELELSVPRSTVAIRVGDGVARRMDVTETLAAPYFLSFGTWSRGAVPAHEFSYDDVTLWY